MTDLLDALVSYLASHTGLVSGISAFYNEMPDEPAKCLVVQEEQNGYSVPAQIDAEVHRIRITTRDVGNELSCTLAQLCWRWMLTDATQYDADKRTDTTGFIQLLDDTVIQVRLFGNPVWDKADQQNRKYYCFYALIITPR